LGGCEKKKMSIVLHGRDGKRDGGEKSWGGEEKTETIQVRHGSQFGLAREPKPSPMGDKKGRRGKTIPNEGGKTKGNFTIERRGKRKGV